MAIVFPIWARERKVWVGKYTSVVARNTSVVIQGKFPGYTNGQYRLSMHLLGNLLNTVLMKMQKHYNLDQNSNASLIA